MSVRMAKKAVAVGLGVVWAACAAPHHAAAGSVAGNATDVPPRVPIGTVHTDTIGKEGAFGGVYDADGALSQNLPAEEFFWRNCGKPQCPSITKRAKRSHRSPAPAADTKPAHTLAQAGSDENNLLGGEYGFDVDAFFAQMEEIADQLGPFVDDEPALGEPSQHRMRVASLALWQSPDSDNTRDSDFWGTAPSTSAAGNGDSSATASTTESAFASTAASDIAGQHYGPYVAQAAVHIAADSTEATTPLAAAEDDTTTTTTPPAPPLWVGNAVVTLVLIRGSQDSSVSGNTLTAAQQAPEQAPAADSPPASPLSSSHGSALHTLPPPPVEEVLVAVTDMEGVATFRSSYPALAKDESLRACVRSVEFPANPDYFVFEPAQDPESCFALEFGKRRRSVDI